MKVVWLLLGYIFLALGIIGLILPLMPGGPFVVLAALCFFRGSERLYQWLRKHRILGKYVDDYYEGRGVPRSFKIFMISIAWITADFGLILFAGTFRHYLLICLCPILMTAYFLWLPTSSPLRKKKNQEKRI